MDAQRGIARRMVIGLPADGRSPAWERDFAAYPPAGVILFARDFRDLEDLRRLTAKLRDLARPRRLLVAMDEEGGFVSQLAAHLTVPPNAALLARGASPGDLEWIARDTGQRLRALGVDWDFAPVADIHSEPSNPVIGPRAYGTQPEQVGRDVAEILAGLRAAGIASCLKHFPGHGDTLLDSHIALPRCDASLERLEARELVPFRANLAVPSVMTAHVVYDSLDGASPGTFSRAVTHGLLRERLGYRGLSITDALEMTGASAGREPAETGRLALEAGCDLLLYATYDEGVRRARLQLADALVEGGLDRAGFDESRPRLAAFDRLHPEPTAAELSRPLEDLTPPEWEPRLEAIAERGLIVRGALPRSAVAGWSVTEPPFPRGDALRAELERLGVPLAVPGAGAVELVVVMSRLPMPAAEVERLRRRGRERALALVGLQSDAFLDQVPEAALRISASDATPLTRRVVARRLAREIRRAAETRA